MHRGRSYDQTLVRARVWRNMLVSAAAALACAAAAYGASETWTLTIDFTGNGWGDVAVGNIACSWESPTKKGACQQEFPVGSPVVFEVKPGSGAIFAGWSGCTTVRGRECSVSGGVDTTATATLLRGYPVIVKTRGKGTGVVSSTPAGISCGQTCVAGFRFEQQVTLQATPRAGSRFEGWGGACRSPTARTCTVAVDTIRFAIAYFARR